MPVLGKLSPTNGNAISVKPDNGFKGKKLRARLLLNNGRHHFEGMLQVTMGNFINAPTETILAWIYACNRSPADIRGPANERNTVHFFRDDGGWINLHFSELESNRIPAHDKGNKRNRRGKSQTSTSGPTTLAIEAVDLASPPPRVPTTTQRIVRDSELVKRVKLIHHNRCQLKHCKHEVRLPNNKSYVEGHHLKPLGRDHNGSDRIDNILCVCPHHHAILDMAGISLKRSQIHELPNHPIAGEFLDYHNSLVRKRWGKLAN